LYAPNLTQLWAALIVEELVRSGVTHFIVAPGSRNAPLAIACFHNSKASTTVHFDERGAAYFALGCARMGKPAAVICTSGTAVANCLPAVVEAYYASLPLIILSADRPPELQGCAANQTMNQQGLFGVHLRAELNLPCPDIQILPEVVLSRLDAAVSGALYGAGPVHINCMFREPLAPEVIDNAWPPSYLSGIERWQEGHEPLTRWESPSRQITPTQAKDICDLFSTSARGLILVGRLSGNEPKKSILDLAKKLGWPVFADITSGCRRNDLYPGVIRHYDLMLRSSRFRKLIKPDLILHLGDVFVSKQLQEFLKEISVPYVQITPCHENRDPVHSVTRRYAADPLHACSQLAHGSETREPNPFLTSCISMDNLVHNELKAFLEEQLCLSEILIANQIDSALSSDSLLFLGNSMPVRDMDMFASQCRESVVHANRGVSGIDGNIATAAGMSKSAAMPIVAVLGDMSSLHDLNSFSFLASNSSPVILVILNNHGGGIFSFLPISKYSDVLEKYFTNPHNHRFNHIAAMFYIDYRRVDSKESFTEVFLQALQQSESVIIEVDIDIGKNVESHKQFFERIVPRVDAFRDNTIEL
jgi:2-succinyl-5-enolpyruvyl-6-hydroxy-3-cyclohexene-1-carboxylate synthase